MSGPETLAEVWRGPVLESVHLGHAVIVDETGQIVDAWGNPDEVVLPRSSVKMIQALPLVESGAADAAGLGSEHLALSCASHSGAEIHTSRVARWLDGLGLSEADLRCGAHMPQDAEAAKLITCSGDEACQLHNNCSGKHAGFLTLNRHLGGGSDYVEIDHPVQVAAKQAFEEVTGETSPAYGIDGCSAPNFAASLTGIARAMAGYAAAREGMGTRPAAQARLVSAMMAHPALVAGEGRACTELMRALDGRAAIKTGAEGVYVAILPELKMGAVLKVADGATRASEAAITAILVRLGLLAADHPAALKFMSPVLTNCRGMEVGQTRAAPALLA